MRPRAAAILAGEVRYRTGKPCPNGHLDERLSSNGACLACTRERVRRRYSENPEKYREISRLSKERNIETAKESVRKYDEKNREKRKLDAAARRASRPELHREAVKKYHAKNREKILARRNEIERMRKATDPIYRAERNFRRGMASRLARYGGKKTDKFVSILGCSWGEFVSHIEQIFKPGMSWENRSSWHIDHIKPLCSAETQEELVALWHYTNLQPLWAVENMRKGGRIGVSQ